MQREQNNKAEHYRKEANRYAELARTAQPGFLSELYRKTAVRYVLMADDLEKWPDPLRSVSCQVDSLWVRAEHFLTEAGQAS
jgi:hypothetical protein